MAYVGHNPSLFRLKSWTKVQSNSDDMEPWMKEGASQQAVPKVFHLRRKVPYFGGHGQAMPLLTEKQLRDHEDAYSEAQALLTEWMNCKLRLTLEAEEQEYEGDNTENDRSPDQSDFLQFSNFADLYSYLDQEVESSAVNTFLQDLMKRKVMGCEMKEDLQMDTEREEKKQRDPRIAMEIRHQQVREKRAQKDAERAQKHKEKELRREAWKEVLLKEQLEQNKRKLELLRQEKLLQQEVVRLRREMEEKRILEKQVRLMEKERQDKMGADSGPNQSITQQQQEHQRTERVCKMKMIEARIHIMELRCLQTHFSRWHSAVLRRQVQMGKAAALADWRNQLRVWRAWRMLVWTARVQREVEKTEEDLRSENRECQKALESDRRRLLRRCFASWQAWCCAEQGRREMLLQREETHRKMVALIDAAAAGKLRAGSSSALPETCGLQQVCHSTSETKAVQVEIPAAETPLLPTQALQVREQHTVISLAELAELCQTGAPHCQGVEAHGTESEGRHMPQQDIQKEQPNQTAKPHEMQRMLGLKQEAEMVQGALQPCSLLQDSVSKCRSSQQKPQREVAVYQKVPRTSLVQTASPHPVVKAMEARAKLRTERRKEVEEMKRRREEERLAQLKAEEEVRCREEEEQKQAAAKKKKEEKRLEKMRELEKQYRLEQYRQKVAQAQEHYRRAALWHRGLVPWKQLIEQRHTNIHLANKQHRHSLMRRCLVCWVQFAAEVQAEKEAQAARLYKRILLQRSLSHWLKLKDLASVQEERACQFFCERTLRRTLVALLDYVTQERCDAWDKERLAQEHSDRRVMQKYFREWWALPIILRQEREKEERREHLRRRVAEVLPDFCVSPRVPLW